jgi:choline kinase
MAAGMGTRLRHVHSDQPKGFVRIGDRPIIARSVDALRDAGISEFVFVVGWCASAYRDWCAAECPGAVCITNDAYASTGSLASLVAGCAAVPGRDVLAVESDLLYEPKAVRSLLAAPHADTVLLSDATHSGDEVWVYGDAHGCLTSMSKQRPDGEAPTGELVGLSRFSSSLVLGLVDVSRMLPASAHYEDGLNAVCPQHPISLLVLPGLAWCEIDNAAHLARARTTIWPRIVVAQAQPHASPQGAR